ncbi:MAG: TonB-dependent receptor [Candidatus Eremiobacteraeota bacterium]|nr:TonB-dependent receptor [Candidatus Eremiobacteraeota bacterium]
MVALPLVAPPPVAYAGTTGVISGKVLDEHNAPVSAAKVTATSPSQTASGVTNGSGFFSLLNLSPDTYTVTLVKQAYQTTSAPGITVQADQISHVDIVMHTELHTIGRVTTTAQAGLVSKNVTGDLYTVNAQKINSYQGSAGGAETLYSQNGVVGSLPGVTRTVGTGGGYAGNGSLSVRGGSNDQIGFELEGIPLNRAFDSANGTAFLTNGLSSLEVYTGGEPADAGRSMSGYINEIIRRGSYPGGGDFTFVIGTPALNNTYQADIYGGTPNKRFTYYASLLWINAGYNFGNSSNLDNTTINVPANDPGCPLVNVIITGTIPCASPNSFNAPISSGAWQSFLNPLAHMSDGVINLNWTIEHNGLSDDLQALYNTGYTWNPFLYSGPFVDPAVIANCGFEVVLSNPCPTAPGGMTWPYGMLYTGPVAQPLNTNPSSYYTLTWPTSGQSLGLMPSNYLDSQTTQSAIEKLSYTRALTPSSFVRLYGYMVYSLWNFNQATNVWQGDSFYDLHDNAGGVTANYQNQLSQQHLIRADVDYLQERSLRYNYAPNSAYPDDFVNCFPTTTVNYGIGAASLDYGCTGAFSGTPEAVAQINGPYAYYNSISPTTYDAAIADTWRPSDRWTVDVGFRWDDFVVPLMPLQITGPNGVAELAQNQSGTCLHGYAYAPTEPCAIFLNASGPTASGGDGTFGASALPGAGNWTNVSGSLNYTYFSPRLGITYTASATDVIRASVGRYVQPPATAYEEYIGAPQWGATDTVAVLNNFYDGLGFTAVHNVQPQDSTNYDASYEHDFKNGMSMKVSPFYRVTRGQILNLPVNPLQPTFETGYNFGAAKISGFEFLAADNHQGDGWNGTLSATYTNSKIRFEAPIGGSNFIDTVNQQITNYNNFYGTNYALFDPNGYYPPSLFMSPGNTGASYDVAWVLNLNATYQHQGWEISPTFNYQSGNPYGDPLNFPDPNGNVTFGPDPYTHQFDSLGAFKGPWWLTMNLAVSRDITHNVKASLLYTNVFTIVGNHGYVWEVPSSKQVVSYGDNFFYTNGGSFAGVNPAYTGDSYYPYAPESINPYHQLIFSISTRI